MLYISELSYFPLLHLIIFCKNFLRRNRGRGSPMKNWGGCTIIPTFLNTWIPLSLHFWIPKYHYTYIFECLNTFMPTFLDTIMPTFLNTWIPLWLHFWIPGYHYDYISEYLDTILITFLNTWISLWLHFWT